MRLQRIPPCLAVTATFNSDGVCPIFATQSTLSVCPEHTGLFFSFPSEGSIDHKAGVQWDHSSSWAAGGSVSLFILDLLIAILGWPLEGERRMWLVLEGTPPPKHTPSPTLCPPLCRGKLLTCLPFSRLRCGEGDTQIASPVCVILETIF